MAYMNSVIYSFDNLQRFKIFSESGKGIEIEFSLKNTETNKYNFVTTFYFGSLKEVELFSIVCKQVIENCKYEEE